MKSTLVRVGVGACIGITAHILGLDELYWRAIVLAVLAVIYDNLATWLLEK